MRYLTLLSLFLIGCSAHYSTRQNANEEDGGTNDVDASSPDGQTTPPNGIKDGDEADVDCGMKATRKCSTGQNCNQNADCETDACDYNHKCIDGRSCVNHMGGDTCGSGEVGEVNAQHENCCRSLPVAGFTDASHFGKTVYLDKYEITAGRMRAFVNAVITEMGKPDFKGWVQKHRPTIWNEDWNQFLPSDYEGDAIVIYRMFLGDPRHVGQTPQQAGPGILIPPDTDQLVSTGLNYQFGGKILVDTHGNNCGTYAGSYGFPTYYYPDNVLITNGEMPRKNPLDAAGNPINAQDALDTKSLNCATNEMFQLLCAFDGGDLASSEVIDYVTNSPTNRPQTVSGCGSQFSNHGDLLGNITNTSVFSGGSCADVYGGFVNATFDAGDNLPVPGSFLNQHSYHYPDLGNSNSDKSWEVAAPGRMYNDIIRLNGNEGWKDLAGNLTETTLEKSNGAFTGRFALRGQGVGFGSARSDLNVTLMPGEIILRVQRPESKSALIGARCQFYK